MKLSANDLLLYAVTDRAWLNGKTLAEQVEAAVLGGTTCIQLREKDTSHEDFLTLAKDIKKVTDRYKIPYIINDSIDIMLKCGADGVHIGQHDGTAAEVRRRIGPDKILGVSAQTVEQARRAEAEGADYLGVGAVFPTATKLDANAVTTETLREITASVQIPVVAIGGISRENLVSLAGTGIAGIAVVSAVFAQKDVQSAAQELAQLCGKFFLDRK